MKFKTGKKPASSPAAPVAEKKKKSVTPTAEAKPAAERSGKNIGRTTGLRIMAYQDQTMSEQPTAKLTDEELAAKWQKEFPESRCRFEDRLDVVRTVRRLFNEGRHGTQELKAPKGGVARYELQGKQRVAVEEPKRSRGGRAAEAKSVAA